MIDVGPFSRFGLCFATAANAIGVVCCAMSNALGLPVLLLLLFVLIALPEFLEFSPFCGPTEGWKRRIRGY